jgi:ABC-type phosphate transport system permease subunit
MTQYREQIMQAVFFLAACTSILAVALICLFILGNGVPAMLEIGLPAFLLGKTWRPSNNLYGVLPMILGSVYVTTGAILIGVPVGILTAVFMAEFCPPELYRFLKPCVELLAGIPSVVYGFFGLLVFVPWIRETLGGSGSSILTASLLLGISLHLDQGQLTLHPGFLGDIMYLDYIDELMQLFRNLLKAFFVCFYYNDHTGNRGIFSRSHGDAIDTIAPATKQTRHPRKYS